MRSAPCRRRPQSRPCACTDAIARIIAEPIEERLGQRVNIENRSGAGGNIGAEAVVRARPDGYTWLLGTAGLLSINRANDA